jgi:hypothetical protein
MFQVLFPSFAIFSRLRFLLLGMMMAFLFSWKVTAGYEYSIYSEFEAGESNVSVF